MKGRLAIEPGEYTLQATRSHFEGDVLFSSLRLLNEDRVASATGPSIVRATRDVVDPSRLRYSFEQGFEFDDGERAHVHLRDIGFDTSAPGGARRILDGKSLESYFEIEVELDERDADTGRLTTYSPCQLDYLRLFETRVTTEDGAVFEFVERHDPPVQITSTGPARLVEASVSLARPAARDGLRVVTQYKHLVYTAARHNRGVEYWVILDPPILAVGVDQPVHAIEVVTPEELFQVDPAVHYLGERFEVIASPAVSAVSREEIHDAPTQFRRGDIVQDATVNVTDAIGLLQHLFQGGAEPECHSAADANDDGALNLTDAVTIIRHLFQGAGALPPPIENCGDDPTPDPLDCLRFTTCDA